MTGPGLRRKVNGSSREPDSTTCDVGVVTVIEESWIPS